MGSRSGDRRFAEIGESNLTCGAPQSSLLFCPSAWLHAASLTGIVRDPGGASVAGASVVAKPQRGASLQATTCEFKVTFPEIPTRLLLNLNHDVLTEKEDVKQVK